MAGFLELAVVGAVVAGAGAWGWRYYQINRPIHAETFPCPKCNSREKVVPILYDDPDARLLNLARKEKISLGQGPVRDSSPDQHCLACGHRWASS